MKDPKKSGMRDFLTKRAPFYLAGITLLAVFVVPGLLEKDLRDTIPDTLNAGDMDILERVLRYDGMDGSGINVEEAISDRIVTAFPDGNVFDHRSTAVRVEVMSTSIDEYRVMLDFESRGDGLSFDWSMDAEGMVQGNNDLTKDVMDVVNFYD